MNTKTVYRKELRALYRGLSGYLIAAAIVTMLGVGLLIRNFNGGDVRIGRMLNVLLPAYAVLIPLMTMRTFAGEEESGTLRYIDALPGEKSGFVFGKFLAVLTAFTLPFVVVLLAPVLLSFYGNVNWLGSYLDIAVFWLLGVSLMAFGFFVSAGSARSWMACAVSFCVIAIDYMLPYAAINLPVGVRKIVSAFSVFYQYRYFSIELFDLRTVLLYAALALLFLFLTCRTVEKRRLKKQ